MARIGGETNAPDPALPITCLLSREHVAGDTWQALRWHLMDAVALDLRSKLAAHELSQGLETGMG